MWNFLSPRGDGVTTTVDNGSTERLSPPYGDHTVEAANVNALVMLLSPTGRVDIMSTTTLNTTGRYCCPLAGISCNGRGKCA